MLELSPFDVGSVRHAPVQESESDAQIDVARPVQFPVPIWVVVRVEFRPPPVR